MEKTCIYSINRDNEIKLNCPVNVNYHVEYLRLLTQMFSTFLCRVLGAVQHSVFAYVCDNVSGKNVLCSFRETEVTLIKLFL